MASTFCSEACLALHLRVKLSSVWRVLAAPVRVALSYTRAARSRRKNQAGYFIFNFQLACSGLVAQYSDQTQTPKNS